MEPDGERVAENELDACLQTGCTTQSDYDMCIEEVAARKRRAVAGQLGPPEDATPVRTQPLLWEIRWDFQGRPLRLYHAEPRRAPAMLLALLCHWKRTSGRTAQIEAAQDGQMSEAAARYGRSAFHPGRGESD